MLTSTRPDCVTRPPVTSSRSYAVSETRLSRPLAWSGRQQIHRVDAGQSASRFTLPRGSFDVDDSGVGCCNPSTGVVARRIEGIEAGLKLQRHWARRLPAASRSPQRRCAVPLSQTPVSCCGIPRWEPQLVISGLFGQQVPRVRQIAAAEDSPASIAQQTVGWQQWTQTEPWQQLLPAVCRSIDHLYERR